MKRQIVDRTGDFRKPDPAWEAELLKRADSSPQEHVLEIADFDSLEGATHEILADRSVLISGEVPDRDTYTAVIRTSLTGIRGIKLEALTDPSLPGNGPGRGDPQRPNFVLSRFTAEVAPAAGGSAQRIKFTKAEADFSQNNFDVASCLDDSPKGGWAINPQFGKPHWAMFLADRPFGDAAGCVLTVRL